MEFESLRHRTPKTSGVYTTQQLSKGQVLWYFDSISKYRNDLKNFCTATYKLHVCYVHIIWNVDSERFWFLNKIAHENCTSNTVVFYTVKGNGHLWQMRYKSVKTLNQLVIEVAREKAKTPLFTRICVLSKALSNA